MPILRLLKIFWISYTYRLDALMTSRIEKPWFGWLMWCLGRHKVLQQARGVRLRKALEALGPIFVKFGQVLSTRQDIIPPDIAAELSQLQDNVPPFSNEIARQKIESGLGQSIDQLFRYFGADPIASASIAQVYFAELHSGKKVAVKVIRPKIEKIILKDLQIMGVMASIVEKFFADGKRLRPKEVVAEFKKYLADELDLVREAANCSQLRRNFDPKGARGHLLIIPEVYWDYTSKEVFTMERMEGIPISRKEQLLAAGVNIQQLAQDGVEIFFTQVFSDGFFHADMHPGNIYVSNHPLTLGRYIALDFGIVGSLSEYDKNYLAQNFLAFFQRDYRRVAQLHIESGWAPPETREEELEGAIRACCEPIFDRPISQISLGMVLLRLFQTSRRFNISVQPQLVLLQKTLLNIEGLGRQLDPDLDLWKTAKPYLENWMHQRVGLGGLKRHLEQEARQWSVLLPQLPRLLHQRLAREDQAVEQLEKKLDRLENRCKFWQMVSVTVVILLIVIGLRLFAVE